MFFRVKHSGPRSYLQIVENYRHEGRPRQRVIATLGRLEELTQNGQIESLLASGARFAEQAMVLTAHRQGDVPELRRRSIGPALIFERLWAESGCQAVIEKLGRPRRFGFSLERAIFLTVLHRLFCPGSDRAAERWREAYRIAGVESLSLHQLYRAMAWLGEELTVADQADRTPFAPRCTKDVIEERLFEQRRDLFTTLDLVFFDTTSIYFEGAGGETLGQHGHSKDHRPDLKQMVVGMVLDGDGHPLLCEFWPGNTTDVKSLIPIVARLQARFGVGQVCIVADRGMISQDTLAELERRNWLYILGARLRSCAEVRKAVLSRPGRYHVVHPKGAHRKDPSPLAVKEVRVEGRRYVVCFNEDQAQKDAADRAAILSGLTEQLTKGPKSLVGNKGYRKYLTSKGGAFTIDAAKVKSEERFDGKWVLRTNTTLATADVALKYKDLWRVEAIFRTMKSLLETRPIYHHLDETIRGHVFCSFLALVLRKALEDRLHDRGETLEWADVLRSLDGLEEIEVTQNSKRFLLRTAASGPCGKVFQAVGVALPPTVRPCPPTENTSAA